VEVEGGRVPTPDWMLNLQILTSGGFQWVGTHSTTKLGGMWVFRMMQKTRYKRRKAHTLEKALELELYARMSEHPLYQHNVRELPVHFQETAILKMAA